MGLLTSGMRSSSDGADSERTSLRRDLSRIVREGALTNIFVVLTSGAFVTGLALMLGANDFEIGLLTALPYLAQATQPLSILLPGLANNRKWLSIWGITVGRQIWWLVIPLLFFKSGWALAGFLTLLTFSAAAIQIVTPVWLSWVSDIVPREIRGRFFGSRSAWIAATTLVFSILGSLVLDWTKAGGRQELGFAIIVAAAAVAAFMGSMVLNRVSDVLPAASLAGRAHPGGGWARPIKDVEFRRILRVFGFWYFAIGISAPFFSPHMLLNLKMSFFLIGMYSAVSAIVAITANRPWGTLIDRFGSRSVMTFCAAGIGFIPLIWLLPRPDFLWVLAIESVYSGLLWAGMNLASFTLPIDKSPQDDRTYYLAWFAAVTGLTFFAASILGGLLAESLSDFVWKVGKQTFVNYHIIFVISAILRIASARLMLVLTEPAERRIPMMVQVIGHEVLKMLPLGRQTMPPPADKFVKQERDNIGPDDQVSSP
jgi:MFS family permease